MAGFYFNTLKQKQHSRNTILLRMNGSSLQQWIVQKRCPTNHTIVFF